MLFPVDSSQLPSNHVKGGASGTPGMIRVSFGIYNTEEEVEQFLKVLAQAIPAAKAYVQELIEDFGEESQAFDPSF